MNIAIRVDGNTRLGMGNVYRSLTLARELSFRGLEVCFIMKSYPGSFEIIQENQFPIYLVCTQALNGTLNSQIEHIIRDQDIKMLINDVKDTEEDYIQHLKKMGLTVVNFDDLGEGRNHADVLFDAFYQRPATTAGSQNFGPEFVVLRKEFECETLKLERSFNKVNFISVMMGATNTGALLEKIIRTLTRLSPDIHCNIILSQSINDPENFQTNYSQKNFTFHYQPENIAEIFAHSDIAITAGGISMCESCALGTPTLVIPQVPHESENARYFVSSGAVVALDYDPDIDEDIIYQKLLELIEDHTKRRELSLKAKELVDGEGLRRIADILQRHLVA